MKIVFNTNSLIKENRQDTYFLREVLNSIIIKYPAHTFIILTDQLNAELPFYGKNVILVPTRQSFFHPVLRKFWFDFKLPVILKKYKADVFISCDGFCSLRTQLPQCILLHDLTFFYNPSPLKKSYLFFYKRYLPEFLRKANTIVCVSAAFKKDLSARYGIGEDKIDVITVAAKKTFLPIDESTKEETKKRYSQEKNYFICTEGIHSPKSLTNVLRAFSVFKKRQKSNWKLMITGTLQKQNTAFYESLKTYKYRDDIILPGPVIEEDKAKLIGSAYALIYPVQWNNTGIAMLEALNCHVPVIASINPLIKEMAGNAVLYTDIEDPLNLADQMMLLYKDETLRSKLVEKGKALVTSYSLDKSGDLLWQSIQKAFSSVHKSQK